MELRHLRAFCAVAQEMHVTKAARRLNIAQPALTQQMRLLERDLEFPLMLPKGRGFQLTQAGSFFHGEAEALLANLDNACLKAKELARGESGCVQIGVTEGASFNPTLAMVFTAFQASYPGVHLTFTQRQSPELAADLRDHRIDVAFMCPMLDPEGLSVSRLYAEEMLLALPSEHPLSDRAKTSLGDLRDEPLLLISHGNTEHSLTASLSAACQKLGFVPRIAQTVPEFMLALNLVAAGIGITFVPSYMTSIHTKRIAYKKLKPATDIKMETVVVRRRDEAFQATVNLDLMAQTIFGTSRRKRRTGYGA